MTVKNGRENYTCSERSKFMEKIKFTKIIENYNLKNYIPEIDTDKIYINTPEVNRPALQLAGFFDHFDKEYRFLETWNMLSLIVWKDRTDFGCTKS